MKRKRLKQDIMSRLYKLYKKILKLRLFLNSPKIFFETSIITKNLNSRTDVFDSFLNTISSELEDYNKLRHFLYNLDQRFEDPNNLKLLVKSLENIRYFDIDKVEQSKEIKQICMIGDMGIGNFLHLIPFLKSLKKNFPSAQIVIIFTKKSPVIKLIDLIHVIDKAIVFEEGFDKSVLHCSNFVDFLHYYNVKPNIIFTRFTKNFYALLLNIIFPTSYRIGHSSSAGFESPFMDRALSHHIKMDIQEHEIIRNLNLLQPLNINHKTKNLSLPEFNISQTDKDSAKMILHDNKLTGKDIIFFCPGTSLVQSFKRWNEDNWIELILLLKNQPYKFVLLGSKDDKNYNEELINKGITQDHYFKSIVNLCGSTTLNELFCILPYGSLFIGLNSGMTHIANTLGVKTVSMMTSTDNPRTNPYYNNSYYHDEIASDKITKSIIPVCPYWSEKYVTNLDKSVFAKRDEYAYVNEITPHQVSQIILKIINE